MSQIIVAGIVPLYAWNVHHTLSLTRMALLCAKAVASVSLEKYIIRHGKPQHKVRCHELDSVSYMVSVFQHFHEM